MKVNRRAVRIFVALNRPDAQVARPAADNVMKQLLREYLRLNEPLPIVPWYRTIQYAAIQPDSRPLIAGTPRLRLRDLTLFPDVHSRDGRIDYDRQHTLRLRDRRSA